MIWSIQQDRRIDRTFVDAVEGVLAGTEGEAHPAIHDGAHGEIGDEARCRLLATLTFELEGHDDERCESSSAEALRLAGMGRANSSASPSTPATSSC